MDPGFPFIPNQQFFYPNNQVVELNNKQQTVNGKHQTANGKHPTSKMTIANSNYSDQSETLLSSFSFDLGNQGRSQDIQLDQITRQTT